MKRVIIEAKFRKSLEWKSIKFPKSAPRKHIAFGRNLDKNVKLKFVIYKKPNGFPYRLLVNQVDVEDKSNSSVVINVFYSSFYTMKSCKLIAEIINQKK